MLQDLSAQLPGIEPRAEYTNRVREAVLDRVLDDSRFGGTGRPTILAMMRRTRVRTRA